ncbi:diadenosine tetraphosphate hydrolase, partial [Rhizobium leguminosarum]
MAVELGYDARRPVDHPTPFEPTECCKLTRKRSSV